MSFKRFIKKPNIKNIQNMPSPVILTILILVCMLIVFSIESVGLSNREKNLQLRDTIIDASIKFII